MLVFRGVRFILGVLAPQKTNMSPETLWLGPMKFLFVLWVFWGGHVNFRECLGRGVNIKSQSTW